MYKAKKSYLGMKKQPGSLFLAYFKPRMKKYKTRLKDR